MSARYYRGRLEGEVHRARLRALLLPRLFPGALLPRHAWVGAWLGVSPSEGGRHLTRVLHEAGVTVQVCGKPRRVRVVAMPDQEMAA